MATETTTFEQDLETMTPKQLLKKYNQEQLFEIAREHGVETEEDMSKATLLDLIQEEITKPETIEPTPTSMVEDAPAKPINPNRGHSTIDAPVYQTWHITDAMFTAARAAGLPDPKRKAVVEACMARGVAYYTARTQYQCWFKHTDKGTRLISAGNAIPVKKQKAVAAE